MESQVRTFRARDCREALAQVKAALGPEAVILSTREVSGLLRQTEIEITAARQLPAPAAESRKPGPSRDPELAEQLRTLRHALEDTRRHVNQEREQRTTPALQGLLARGFEPALARRLLEQASGPAGAGRLASAVAERIQVGRAPWLPGRRKVIALVGPPGVGKTTTLAKIAARARMLESKPTVALITVDTYRIGARDHLARYAEILGVTLRSAASGAELRTAVAEAAEADLVLIDTAGRSDAAAVDRQGTLLRAVPGIELHLTLSAASGYQQLAATAQVYRAMRPDRLVLTRLDEAVTPGAVLSALARLPTQLACIADGQRVPEDVHAVDSTHLARLMLEADVPAEEEGTHGFA